MDLDAAALECHNLLSDTTLLWRESDGRRSGSWCSSYTTTRMSDLHRGRFALEQAADIGFDLAKLARGVIAVSCRFDANITGLS